MAATKAARKAAEHGRHIFIYNNIRTNQTVYSLQRSLNNHSVISQLPYAGKKTVPAKLRKDVWRPLATVTFPLAAQGLSAYRRLREFRKLHELHWDNNGEYPMLPVETQKKIKEGKAAPTKKEKGKIIMDQKANTVADLAAVLKMQDEEGGKIAAGQFESGRRKHRNEVKQLEEAVEELQKGGAERIKAKIATTEAQLQDGSLPDGQVKTLRKRVLQLHFQKNKLLGAEEALERKRSEEKLWELADKARTGAIGKLRQEILDAQDSLETEKNLSEGGRARLEQLVEELSKELDELREARDFVMTRQAGSTDVGKMQLPKYGRLRKRIQELNVPRQPFSAEGVKIRWADLLDAEYAESWPTTIQHEELGLTRHTAPDPDMPPTAWPKTFEQEDVNATGEGEEDVAEEAESSTGKVAATA
ncbi:hypothetical protein GTA08_BOTSDO01558 [Botryosphaeria dothidea]|uniref:Large ribosomal subunit protein mL67 n=1 Tax=Botryosphaeria dothidea TaxID=55169 RepID=A0A8H4J755_9PEZI|nr:hypothetical protein GTA08_BOTSDO01558 [Botryosphaeria dothidea]